MCESGEWVWSTYGKAPQAKKKHGKHLTRKKPPNEKLRKKPCHHFFSTFFRLLWRESSSGSASALERWWCLGGFVVLSLLFQLQPLILLSLTIKVAPSARDKISIEFTCEWWLSKRHQQCLDWSELNRENERRIEPTYFTDIPSPPHSNWIVNGRANSFWRAS